MSKINTAEGLQEAVEKRANQRVQERIKDFKLKLVHLFGELMSGSTYHYGTLSLEGLVTRHPKVVAILKDIAAGNIKDCWPTSLWEQEREIVMKEILAITDEVQRALQAPDPSPKDALPRREVEEDN